jgi:hypothetical protein
MVSDLEQEERSNQMQPEQGKNIKFGNLLATLACDFIP